VGAGAVPGRSSRRGARCRARLWQTARSAASARMPPTTRPPGVVSCRVAQPWSSRRTRSDSSDGSPATVSASQMTVPPAAAVRPSSASAAIPPAPAGGGRPAGPGRSTPGRSSRSTMATRCGGAPPGPARVPSGPAAAQWGSRSIHRHAGSAAGGQAARNRRSSGAWKAASSQTTARARARARAGGPVRAMTASRRSGITSGASGRWVARPTSRCAAARSSGSCSVSGSAGRSSRTAVARGTGPRPTRTVRKSASLGRRSQSRSVRSTVAHSRGRSGWTCSAAASWAAARRSAWSAAWSRWPR
jgi:hypothetical protein